MSKNTDVKLRNQLIYQIFVRNFSEEGTFQAVRSQLDRIRELGTDIVYLMPIHPIGKIARKGALGSPYAISDYRAVNPEFGTLEDFRELVDDIHSHDMKCIIDVVYNHTSPDSVLSREHPEWFFHRPDGSFGNRVGDWTDIIDLDYSNKELWKYQIETLCYWAELVDGFRCDVAPLIPIEFWLEARKAVEKVREGCIWLSESVEPEFITYLRSQGLTALSDSEVYQAFDICYDYDVYGEFVSVLNGSTPLERFIEAINRQETIFPANYVKLRFLENHDQTRAAFLIPDEAVLRSLTAFMFFQKGTAFVYAGQEYEVSHLPSLFDKDTVDYNTGKDISGLIKKLSAIKKEPVFAEGSYKVASQSGSHIIASYNFKGKTALGVFPLKSSPALINVDMPDGFYQNELDGEKVEIFRGMLPSKGKAVIILSDNS